MSLFLTSSTGSLTDNFFKGTVLVLEGLIGVGKTTLGKSLKKYFTDSGIKCKFFKEYMNKELLVMYLEDKEKYAFLFQGIMVTKRVQIYKKALEFSRQGGFAIVDRGIMGDMAFAKMQFDNGFFTPKEYDTYNSLIKKERISSPDITLYLKTSPKVAFDRMLNRGSEAEKKSYTLKYFQDLESAHLKIFENNINVIVTDFDWNEEKEIKNLCLGEHAVRKFLNQIIRSKIDFAELETNS